MSPEPGHLYSFCLWVFISIEHPLSMISCRNHTHSSNVTFSEYIFWFDLPQIDVTMFPYKPFSILFILPSEHSLITLCYVFTVQLFHVVPDFFSRLWAPQRHEKFLNLPEYIRKHCRQCKNQVPMSDEWNIRKDVRVGGNELYSWNREELRISLKLLPGNFSNYQTEEQWEVRMNGHT